MSNKLFGTDGIRGIANRHPMTAEIALRTGRAVARYFRGRAARSDQQSIILIGKDTRRSSYMIEQALAAGVTSQGAYALLVGPMPSPGVAFLARSMRADAGVMISASHNTFEYNGIKLFGPDGFKLPDQVESEIENLIMAEDMEDALPMGDGLGRAKRIDDALGRYVVMAKGILPSNQDLRGLKIVLDCAHGAAYKAAPTVFEELGAEVIRLGCEPNGVNINHESGALHPGPMTKKVLEHKAHIGIALDGDADRVILCDEKGQVVDGDQLMAILAIDLFEQGRLAKNTLVATVMSNMGLELALRKYGIRVAYTNVGDRFVVDLMRKEGFNLGGEQSGHIVALDWATTGDGVVAALGVLSVLQRKQKSLSALRECMTVMPQVLKNVRVKQKTPLHEVPEIFAEMEKVKAELGQSGRLLVRYSGTEPLCRVMIEGEDKKRIGELADDLIRAIEKHLV